LTDLLAVAPDVVIVVGAIMFTVKCYGFSRSLKNGYLARTFLIVGSASLLFVFAELGHLVADVGLYPIGELLHDIIEASFLVVLAIGVSRFFPSWMPKPR
jgi:hypothetical protein